MVIPKPIYEFLPVLYVTSGFMASHSIASSLADFSALLLGIVAVMVVMLRVDHRRNRDARLRGRKYSARMATRLSTPERNPKYYYKHS